MPAEITFVPYFISDNPKSLIARFRMALKKQNLDKIVEAGSLVAIKTHFGEDGLVSYLRPDYARTVVDAIRNSGGKPFLTDTNTLYRAKRHHAVDHIETAMRHGYGFASLNAPIIIADGLRGHAYQEAAVPGGKHFQSVSIPDAIHDADSLFVLSHFTAHLAASFGASIKNLSMGCSNPQGKRRMHCHSKPTVDADTCTACGTCTEWCPTGAISIDEYAVVDEELCMACGECTVVCPTEAIKIPWDENSSILQEKMAEYALAVTRQKSERLLLINALVDITPHCDCMGVSETPFHADVGLLIGTDPLALDQASVDFVNGKLNWTGSRIEEGQAEDPLRGIYPKIDWNVVLEYGEKIGLGSRDYEITVEKD